MQTFLPHPGFAESARCLDRRRLGKQRVECLQILLTLRGESTGWANHPAVRMWRGYESALGCYGLIICNVWTEIGYRDNCHDHIRSLLPSGFFASSFDYPPWFGGKSFHASHRSNLLRKQPDWYGRFRWIERDDLPYVWPV